MILGGRVADPDAHDPDGTVRFSTLCCCSLATACADPRLASVAEPHSPHFQTLVAEPIGTARSLQLEFREIARNAWPSIVTVRAYVKTDSAPRPEASDGAGWSGERPDQIWYGYRLLNAGTGFFVDSSGEVLTCAHILQRPDDAPVDLIDVETQDGSRILADVVGREPTVNFAILRCAVLPAGHSGVFPALELGDSDELECGDWTFGIGDPAGPEKFFAAGTFVAKPARECYQDYLSAFYMQAAMVAPPQAYGGPLLNLEGEIVGILAPRDISPGNHGDLPRQGVELALPVKIVEGLYETIRTTQSTRSPWLGFSVMSRDELALARGVEAFNSMSKPSTGIYVESVFVPSPASTAGIRPGDFLVGFDTFKVSTPVDFQRHLYLAGIGEKVELELWRRGRTVNVELPIERRPPEAKPR